MASYSLHYGSKSERYSNVPPLETIHPGSITFNLVNDGFVGRSYAAMKPTLQSKTSILNFLYELSDIRRIFTSTYGAIKSLLNRRVLDAAAETHLNYSFGVKPFIGDILTLANAVDQFNEDLKKFQKGLGEITTSHYKEEYDDPGYTEETVYSTVKYTKKVPPCKIQVVATMKFKYTIDREFNDIVTFARYLGLRSIGSTLKITWDAIPFSFVIDWFWKVGNYLASFDDGAIPVKLTVLDYCVSTKYRRESYLYVEGTGYGGTYMTPAVCSNGRASITDYQRTPLRPDIPAAAINLPVIDGLSIRELALGGSLLYMNRGSRS
jgi:hypothetical protein